MTDVREGRRTGAAERVGVVVCAGVLAVGHLATGYVLLVACTTEPDGPWDRQAATNSGFAAGFGLALSVVTVLLTLWFVRAEWLRAWWYAIPTALAAAAILRLTLLAPAL
ncbi:hypothetical protein ACFVZW_23180 [Streptomyces sp. NPDC059567]|uniref:hypothetical protein n=1 Tax=Streptomyces sp. NPDC059567 TaxID=3346867 RepID=UPI0036BC0769